MSKPNVVFVFADEWRAQATGYNGDENCITPNLDALRAQSLDMSHAVATLPVCCPYRACLMTGQYPQKNGVFINDVELDPNCDSIARAFKRGGYQTGYIGKWHLYGSPDGRNRRRRDRVPRSHQLGFDDWWGFECCHNYWESPYYYNDDPTEHRWEGYDLFAQTDKASEYIMSHAQDEEPFMLMLSWGPPHFPLHTAPEEYKKMYENREILLRPNVPEKRRERAIEELRGYYAHIAAADVGLGRLLETIDKAGVADNTIFVFTADHGEMAQSQALDTKFHPFDESVRVPFLVRWPEGLGGRAGDTCTVPIDAPDIMPTLLGLCDLDTTPKAAQGVNWAPQMLGLKETTGEEAAFLQCPAVFTELCQYNMPAYRGIFNRDHTYVRSTEGPWLLFDHKADPYQMRNLIDRPEAKEVQEKMEALLVQRLDQYGDEFKSSEEYLKEAGLDHYKETKYPLIENWEWPWGND